MEGPEARFVNAIPRPDYCTNTSQFQVPGYQPTVSGQVRFPCCA